MEVEWPPAREPTGQRAWRDVLRPVAVEMTATAGDLAQRAVARMQAECPELYPDAQTVEENLGQHRGEHSAAGRHHGTRQGSAAGGATAGQRADRPLDLPRGLRVAVGESDRGLDGFRRTYIEAIHARRVASLIGPRADTLTHCRSVAVAALGTADPELALAFVTDVLGSLADNDDATRRIAMTLSAYLGENRSRNRAADRLSIHPNAVSYRVRRAEELLGRSVDIDTLDLRVALAMLPGLTRPRATEL
ncbi:PucR family transcriptional regulator [Nocardia pseudovaccinii]|uniref:PucR family transcriptional regulator n=1 Tax=Nocardia pseudovaccinii TaxID=189540 RepID=UPI0007A48F73|nr:helix-turn-helix domain-containing protein [Nocardia pseudovaccinii]